MKATLARSLIALLALCFAVAVPAAAQDGEKEIGYVSQKAFLSARGHRVSGETEASGIQDRGLAKRNRAHRGPRA
jgi:hypothetical protein